ncbi:MAG: SagB/ThcOx family dehydrogenase [Thermosynechococcaceae cyanobacterium]
MLSSSPIQQDYHEVTKHSVRSVQIDPNYVDARTQPASFKTYPSFFRRFPLDLNHPFHPFLSLTSAITDQKNYREGSYSLRVQPSAGALYPTELYVQLRGIHGMLDGIYHLEPNTCSLTLIYELIDDALEGYWPDSRLIKGCILLVSCVYFRSSWKYKNRSLRYCFLDSGHHLGAIEAAAYASHHPYQIRFDVDGLALNDDLGFETKEFVTAAVVIGEPKAKTVRRLRSPLPFVAGTDYFEPNRFIEAGYKQTLSTLVQTQSIQQPTFPLGPTQWQQAIAQRRSARRFYPHSICLASFQTIWSALKQPIPSPYSETLTIYAVVQRVTDLQPGLYCSNFLPSRDSNHFLQDSYRLKVGEFQAQTGHLCINQAIARDGAVVFFIVADCRNYRVALQQAGLLGHRIYLAATALNLGCSGIGAFYDDETQAFLDTDRPVLYAMAIGQILAPHQGA